MVEIELNSAGVRELLKSAELRGECEAVAQRILSSAGDGYQMKSRTAGTRTVTTVSPSTPHAHFSNLKHNTLLKALYSA